MKHNWIQLGHKQHFICARNCQFSLATLLTNGYVVSTIGELYTKHSNDMETIGCNYFYETMVFKTTNELEECGCPKLVNYSSIDFSSYQTAKEAQFGHLVLCHKYDRAS